MKEDLIPNSVKLHRQCLDFCKDVKKKKKIKARNVANALWKSPRGLYGNRRTSCSCCVGLCVLVFSLSPRDSTGFLLCLQSLM